MIVKPPISPNDIITLKLLNGDEVVGKMISDELDVITVSKPLVVAMGQQGFGLMSYTITADQTENVDFRREHVIIYTRTLERVAAEYVKQTTNLII